MTSTKVSDSDRLDRLSAQTSVTNGSLKAINDNGCLAHLALAGLIVGGSWFVGSKIDSAREAFQENTIELRKFREEFHQR